MNARLLSFALAGLLAPGLVDLKADDAPADASADTPPAITTSASQHNPAVTCTSSDTLACADTLQMADDARSQLAPLLKLGPTWRFPVHIHVMAPDDPLITKINREAAAVFADDSGMHIEAVLPLSDPDAHAFIQRQFVTALLWEKFFANTNSFNAHTPLSVVPVWLVEGLREWLIDDPDHNRESIVRKAVEDQRAPTLDDITGWTSISKDPLMELWQGSFCFYLVDSIVKPGDRRDGFEQWLTTLSGPNPSSARLLFPTEMGWQRELVDATKRSQSPFYTWDQTMAALNATDVITVPGSKNVGTLETVTSLPNDAYLTAALQQKLLDLTSLELRAHPSWHPTLELYRLGLTAMINNKTPGEVQKIMQEAREVRDTEIADHQKLVDYVNWFEVTRDYPGVSSHFTSYFNTAQQLEQAQADPAHPNPIRAGLLRVESQL